MIVALSVSHIQRCNPQQGEQRGGLTREPGWFSKRIQFFCFDYMSSQPTQWVNPFAFPYLPNCSQAIRQILMVLSKQTLPRFYPFHSKIQQRFSHSHFSFNLPPLGKVCLFYFFNTRLYFIFLSNNTGYVFETVFLNSHFLGLCTLKSLFLSSMSLLHSFKANTKSKVIDNYNDNFMFWFYGACAKKKKLSCLPGFVITRSKVNLCTEQARFHESSQPGKWIEKFHIIINCKIR